MVKIMGLFVGKTSLLANDFESSILKSPVPELIIKKSQVLGDAVTNLKYHGGDMRVLHHYSQKNYAHLKSTFPDIAHKFVPGSFGENIVTEEMTEAELCIGDIYEVGSVKIQLTVSRRPCATINYAYQDNRILKEVMTTGADGLVLPDSRRRFYSNRG